MLCIVDKMFEFYFFIGIGKFVVLEVMVEVICVLGSQLVILVMKCVDLCQCNDVIFVLLLVVGVNLLLNILGVKMVEEVVFVVCLVWEVLGIYWLKLEIYLDVCWLLFDLIEILKVVELLVCEGFVVLFYCGVDLVLCK